MQLACHGLFSVLSNNRPYVCAVFPGLQSTFPYIMSFYSQSNPMDTQPEGRQCSEAVFLQL